MRLRLGWGSSPLRLPLLAYPACARRVGDQPKARIPALQAGRLELTPEDEEEADARAARPATGPDCPERKLA